MNAKYKNPDNDSLPWTSSDAFASDAATHQGMVYAIQHPFTGKMLYPSDTAHWRYQQDAMLEYMSGWCEYKLEDLHDEAERAKVCGIPADEVRKDVKGIVLAKSPEESRKQAEAVYKRGQWPRFYFTNGGKGGIRRKTYLDSVGGRLPTNFFNYEECGHTDEAKKEIKTIFGGSAPFDTPKPSRLIERILHISTDPDAVILDSFAGSGTTAHAVLNMNQKDGGSRKFILIEMMDYAESITAERVKRVINGYGEGKNKTEGTGGGFTFYDLGPALLLPDGSLNEEIEPAKIREYIWYMETRTPLPVLVPDSPGAQNPYFLGVRNNTGYYFYYEKDSLTTLSHAFLATIRERTESYVIYADLCTIPEAELNQYNITFRKIPRDRELPHPPPRQKETFFR